MIRVLVKIERKLFRKMYKLITNTFWLYNQFESHRNVIWEVGKRVDLAKWSIILGTA